MSFNVIDILFADSQEEGACKTGHGNKMVQARMAWKVSAPQDIEKDASSNQQHGQQAEKYIFPYGYCLFRRSAPGQLNHGHLAKR